MVSAMNGFIAGTVFIWPDGGNARIQPAAVVVGRLGAEGLRPIPMWVCAPFPGKPYFSVEGRKPFAGKSPGGGESLRLIPGKALFFR